MLSQSFYRPFISHFLSQCFQKSPDFISERSACQLTCDFSNINHRETNQTTTGIARLHVFQGRQLYIH